MFTCESSMYGYRSYCPLVHVAGSTIHIANQSRGFCENFLFSKFQYKIQLIKSPVIVPAKLGYFTGKQRRSTHASSAQLRLVKFLDGTIDLWYKFFLSRATQHLALCWLSPFLRMPFHCMGDMGFGEGNTLLLSPPTRSRAPWEESGREMC